MPLEPFLRPWTGEAVRHIPRDTPYGVLDFRFAGRSSSNRWNYAGEPTLYLAQDRGVALAEFARHLAADSAPGLVEAVIERSVFRLQLAIDAVLDLRDPHIYRELSLRDTPACFLDRTVARATAEYLRRTTAAQALVVPSIAFLDDPTRWLLVVFLDKLPPEPEAFVRGVVSDGTFRVEEHGL